MIDSLLALVPLYGLMLIGGVVAVSCLAVPLPSSMLVMASGGFAAAGDLVLWQVIAVAFAGYALGDQLAFNVARWGGPKVLDRLSARPARAALLERARKMVARWGPSAVLASRTIVSPLGPWTSYVSGAAGLRWRAFTLAAVPGAALWATAYALLGFHFAGQISEIASVILDWSGLILAAAAALGSGWWLLRGWRAQRKAAKLEREPLRKAG